MFCVHDDVIMKCVIKLERLRTLDDVIDMWIELFSHVSLYQR